MPNGFSFGFDFSGLFAFFNSIIAAILSALIFLFNFIVAVFVFVVNVLIVLINTVWTGLRALGRFLRPVWDKVLRPFLRVLVTVFRKIQLIVAALIAPLYRALQCINLVLDFIQTRILRPFQQALFTLRQLTRVLRIFFPKLARAIDRRLARIEQKVLGGFLRIRGAVNDLSTALNRIVTLDGLLQRRIFRGTVIRDIEWLWRILVNAAVGSSPARDRDAWSRVYEPGSTDAILERLRELRDRPSPLKLSEVRNPDPLILPLR